MKLKEYLEALKNCPEEFVEIDSVSSVSKKRKVHKITADFGVYDNWPIFLNADFENVIKHLQESNYSLVDKIQKSYGLLCHLNYNPGTVKLQVFDCTPLGFATERNTEEGRKHYEKQEKNFNMGILLHPYQDKKMEEVNWIRAIAIVIDDIGQYAQKENISICFPCSIGWKILDNYSQIIYFPE